MPDVYMSKRLKAIQAKETGRTSAPAGAKTPSHHGIITMASPPPPPSPSDLAIAAESQAGTPNAPGGGNPADASYTEGRLPTAIVTW